MPLYNLHRLVRLMASNGMDALIATCRENILYLAGFDSVIKTLNPYHGQSYVIVCADSPSTIHVVLPRGEADQVFDASAVVGEVAVYGTFYRENSSSGRLTSDESRLVQITEDAVASSNGLSALLTLLEHLDLLHATIGVDEDGIAPALHATLTASLAQARLISASETFRAIRSVKTRFEVEQLRYAARCVENAITHTANTLRVGISETEIARTFEIALVEQGARPALTMLKIGRHAVSGQRRQSSDITAGRGDFVWFDCDALYNGYWADIARVYALGELKRGEKKLQALFNGQEVAIEKVRPGMTGGEVFDLTMSAVHSSGFPEYRRHHVGHGIGLEPYERPILAPGNSDKIEAGMVISIETPYYEFGLGALHFEDPILVGESGNELLTLQSGCPPYIINCE